jgi:PiT family inorganic phosphate transporter
MILAATLYVLLRSLRLRLGISKESCICVGETQQFIPLPQPVSAISLPVPAPPALENWTGQPTECMERYAGQFLGFQAQRQWMRSIF